MHLEKVPFNFALVDLCDQLKSTNEPTIYRLNIETSSSLSVTVFTRHIR